MSNQYRSQGFMGGRITGTDVKLIPNAKKNRKKMGGAVPPQQPPSPNKAKKGPSK